jgi:phosphate acetyltransferase
MDFYKKIETEAKKRFKTIILPESYDERVIKAAEYLLKKGICKVIFINTGKKIQIKEYRNLDILDLSFAEQFTKEYIDIFIDKYKKTNSIINITENEAKKILKDPLIFSYILLKRKYADSVVAGSIYSTSKVLKDAIKIIGTAKDSNIISSFFIFTFPKNHKFKNKIFAYADCGVIPNPTAEQLSEIAIKTSMNYKKITGINPRTAFLSFSTKGSAKDSSIDKIIEAYNITKKKKPDLVCDGELQFDAAIEPDVAKRKNPNGVIKGNANVFIFPDLNSGNIAYKITERIGGASATGPILQGFAKPVMDLSRGCSAEDIINMCKIVSLF